MPEDAVRRDDATQHLGPLQVAQLQQARVQLLASEKIGPGKEERVQAPYLVILEEGTRFSTRCSMCGSASWSSWQSFPKTGTAELCISAGAAFEAGWLSG